MKKLLSLLLALTLAFALAACGAKTPSSPVSSLSTVSSSVQSPESETADASSEKPAQDRGGAAITLPDNIRSVVVMAPSIAQTLVDLGCGDLITAIDTQTQFYGFDGIKADLPAFDMMTPDTEKLAALQPDVIFVSGLSSIDGSDPFSALRDLGICVVNIPSSASIEGVKEDIAFIAACMGKSEEGQKLTDAMQTEIDRIAAIGASIPADRQKTVYFEIAAAPDSYSFGSGTFLNEMIELVGAKNIFADQQSWLSVDAESAIAANPDVILTNVTYLEDPIGEILSRSGWEKVAAVTNKAVYSIDNMTSSLPNEGIVKALDEMAKAVYPDYYTK